MSVAERLIMDTEFSAEARQRINSARSHDISFLVKRRLGQQQHSPGDIETLVEMITLALDKQHNMSREYVVDYLKSRGRPTLRAEQLADALLVADPSQK